MGNLKVNPQTNEVLNEAGEVVGTLVKDAESNPSAVVKEVENVVNLKNLNSRTLEKLLVYGAGLVAATNGFAQLGMPNSVRSALMGASAIAVLAIHHSSTKS